MDIPLYTGACGIDCAACRLAIRGVCSSCGPGRSAQAARKLDAQKRILGQPCPILACAVLNRVDFCTRDCDQFPCENFESGPYPYSHGFLRMRERRRDHLPRAMGPTGSPITVPEEYWTELSGRDPVETAARTGALASGGGLEFPFLSRRARVEPAGRTLSLWSGKAFEPVEDPLLSLLSLLYLNRASDSPLAGVLAGAAELSEGHFFAGSHAFPLDPLLKRYGRDAEGFARAAKRCGGLSLDMADAAYTLFPFPKAPVSFLLWAGDEEFEARMTVCFDRTIEKHFAADGIWGLVCRVAWELL